MFVYRVGLAGLMDVSEMFTVNTVVIRTHGENAAYNLKKRVLVCI